MPTYEDFSRPLEWITEADLQFAQAIRKWADAEVLPVVKRIDDDWESRALPHRLLKSLCVDLGFQKGLWPQEYGGLGVSSCVTFVVCCEEIARADAGLATAAVCIGWPFLPILLEPHKNQRLIEKFAPMFCDTDRLVFGCAAITDGRSGADVENIDGTHGKYIATTARLDGDEWVINGHKLWCTNSGGEADLFCVFCTTDRDGGDDSVALIYVPADTPGVTQGKPYQKAGMSGDSNSDIWFENVRVPKENRAQGPGKDAECTHEFISWGNIITGSLALGSMNRIYELVKDWCSTRVVGGKILKEHSITAGVLGEIATAIEVCKSDVYLKARMLDRPDIYGPGTSKSMLAKTRATKLFTTDQLTRVVNLAMDLMGSHGYSHEGEIEKVWRDSKIESLWLGGRSLALLDISRYYFDIETL